MYIKLVCASLLCFTVAAIAKDPLPRYQMEVLESLFGSFERASRVADQIVTRNTFKQDRAEVVDVLEQVMRVFGDTPAREDAIGVVVVVDRSPSMDDAATREVRSKIEIARSATDDLLKELGKAAESKGKDVRASVLAFADGVTELMPMTPVKSIAPNSVGKKLDTYLASGTAIGSALIASQKQLARAKLKRNHIVVLTDGENNRGVEPHLVLHAFQFLTAEEFPIVHFVAFDVKRDVFKPLSPYLYKISEASDSRQLKAVIDLIIREEIFAEKPLDLE